MSHKGRAPRIALGLIVLFTLLLLASVLMDAVRQGTSEGEPHSSTTTVSPQTTTPPVTTSPAGTTDSGHQQSPEEAVLSSMSLSEKLGQLLLCGYRDPQEMAAFIQSRRPAGVILFARNIGSPEVTRQAIDALNAAGAGAPAELFVSTDQEGGRVSRLPGELGGFESAAGVGKRGDTDYAEDFGLRMGQAMASLGFNLDFAPVLDIFTNPQNTVIGDRAFGTDADTVSRMGIAVMDGLSEAGVIPCGKHFPGHGDTLVDSHSGLPVVNRTLSELMDRELVPFDAAIGAGLPMLMMSHIVVSTLDTLPASLSPAAVALARDILSFDGVIITDDMEMGALSEWEIGEAGVMAVEAGCDLLLIAHSPDKAETVYQSLLAAVKSGRLTEERIDESVTRILKLKAEYGLINVETGE